MPHKDTGHIEFEQMLRRSRSILYRICLAFTDRQPCNIDDLYQEIVCNLWRGWPQFRNDCDPSTWVYRVALNTAGMELRRQKRADRPDIIPIDDRLRDSLAGEAADPLIEELYRLIDQLPDDEKKLIFLYIDHLSHAQIAAIAGTSEDAVKHRIHRIKKKLITLHLQNDEHENNI